MNFIGQQKLISKIESMSIGSFPHSTILLGEKGCGKHTIANMISERLKLPLVDITNNLTYEYIEDIYQKAMPALYVIDATQITEKEQNTFLKFIEEPLESVFVILLCENKTNVLETVLNRCQIFEFQQYTKDELLNFVTNKDKAEVLINICTTPGKLKDIGFGVSEKAVLDAYELSNKIIDKIGVTNYPNTLTIADKLKYDEETDVDKFTIDIFFNSLVYALFNRYLTVDSKMLYDMYILTVNERKKLKDKRLDEKAFMYQFLSKLWRLCRK